MSVTAVAANGRRVACQTPGVAGRCGPGLDTAASDDAVTPARRTAHDQRHMVVAGRETDARDAMAMDDDTAPCPGAEVANPSGHVALAPAVWAAVVIGDVDRGHVPTVPTAVSTPTRLPDPWTLRDRGDGPDIS